MLKYKSINLTSDKGVDTIWLNRPEVHNAIDPVMIHELTSQIRKSEQDKSVRLIFIRGHGLSFSSGADLGYMKKMSGFTAKENLEDAEKLAHLFFSIYIYP